MYVYVYIYIYVTSYSSVDKRGTGRGFAYDLFLALSNFKPPQWYSVFSKYCTGALKLRMCCRGRVGCQRRRLGDRQGATRS